MNVCLSSRSVSWNKSLLRPSIGRDTGKSQDKAIIIGTAGELCVNRVPSFIFLVVSQPLAVYMYVSYLCQLHITVRVDVIRIQQRGNVCVVLFGLDDRFHVAKERMEVDGIYLQHSKNSTSAAFFPSGGFVDQSMLVV